MKLVKNDSKLFFLIATFVCSLSVYASQEAVVISDRALVYSDHRLSSPVGYLNRGTKLLIGEVKRHKGQAYSTVLNGKIAYVNVNDIQTKAQQILEENATDRIKRKMQAHYPNWLEFRYLVFASSITNSAQADTYENESYTFFGGGIKGHLISSTSDFTKRAAFDYLYASKDNTAFTMYNMDFDIAYSLMKIWGSYLSLYAGIGIVPLAQYKQGEDFTLNGYGYGGQIGADIAIKIGPRFRAHFDSRYHYRQLTGFDIPSRFDIEMEPVIAGAQVSAGVSYAF